MNKFSKAINKAINKSFDFMIKYSDTFFIIMTLFFAVMIIIELIKESSFGLWATFIFDIGMLVSLIYFKYIKKE